MSTYQFLSGDTHRDYRYNQTGGYHNDPTQQGGHGYKRATKRQSGPGKLCPGCGLQRSRMNKCECNS
jgi:hypothetical protein